jgi:hypothetical protein
MRHHVIVDIVDVLRVENRDEFPIPRRLPNFFKHSAYNPPVANFSPLWEKFHQL